jgi:hypothetical protein
MVSPHHRHEASLEGAFEFSSNQSLDPVEWNEANRIFHEIISGCELLQSNKLTTELHSSVSRVNILAPKKPSAGISSFISEGRHTRKDKIAQIVYLPASTSLHQFRHHDKATGE